MQAPNGAYGRKLPVFLRWNATKKVKKCLHSVYKCTPYKYKPRKNGRCSPTKKCAPVRKTDGGTALYFGFGFNKFYCFSARITWFRSCSFSQTILTGWL